MSHCQRGNRTLDPLHGMLMLYQLSYLSSLLQGIIRAIGLGVVYI